MKKIIAMILVTIMSFSLVACGSKEGSGKSAYDISKEAYDNVKKAYDISDAFGSDIYEAWRLGIYSDDEVLEDGAKFLAKELNLTEEEIVEGIIYTILTIDDENGYSNATAEEKSTAKTTAKKYFTIMEDDLFSACIWAVTGAYKANGKVEEAQKALDAAKGNMKELSASYSDYEHYPNLKEYYTTTSAYFDFCQNPDGSFEQVKETINDYRNEARDLNNDLDYIFED